MCGREERDQCVSVREGGEREMCECAGGRREMCECVGGRREMCECVGGRRERDV